MEAERGWRDRTNVLYTNQRTTNLSPAQKWMNRASQLFLLFPPAFVTDPDFAVLEASLQKKLDAVIHHNVYTVMGAVMLLDPGWTFSAQKFKTLCKMWNEPNHNNLIPYLQVYSSLFQILVYVQRLTRV